MKRLRPLFLMFCLAVLAASAFGQAWTSAYEAGLRAAKGGQWTDARTAFLKAAAYRTEDQSSPTMLPGPVTERRQWRNGAPYSPNFLAAYSGYKAALLLGQGDTQTTMLNTAAAELEERLAKGQRSRAAYFLLTGIYTKLGDVQKRDAVVKAYQTAGDKANWKVDIDGIDPVDLGQIDAGGGTPTSQTPTGSNPATQTVKPDRSGNVAPNLSSVVTSVPTKYALIIGNSASKIPGAALPFAGDDAQLLRAALVSNGGYLDANVDTVVNQTAAQIVASANALASRMPNGATLLIFFAGGGVNINGKDYLAGVDSASASDTTTMLAKEDLFAAFVTKSARIFSFFEVPRAIEGGRYFGMELPLNGQIAQVYATIQGNGVTSIYRDGKQTGVFIDAFVDVLDDLKSNGIPILEFGWQLFYKMRRGNTGGSGGGGSQTPTLPVLSHMASDARF